MQMIVPDSAHVNTLGICYVKAWPMLTTDEINVFTDGCAIIQNWLSPLTAPTPQQFFSHWTMLTVLVNMFLA